MHAASTSAPWWTGKLRRMAFPQNEKPLRKDKATNPPAASRANPDDESQSYADALQRIIELANNGAMLGHDHAYDACCKIAAIATDVLRQPTTPNRIDEKPTG